VPETCATPPDQGRVKQARVTSKRQDDIQRASEARATVSGFPFLYMFVAYGTAQDGVHLLCFWSFSWLHYTPGFLVVENKDGKARCELPSYLPLHSVACSFFSFFFLFSQFIMQYIHCIQVRRSHVWRHHCTETVAVKTWSSVYINTFGFDLSAYRHAEANTITTLTSILYTLCVSLPVAIP
jgi:hypothetical protein